MKRASWVAAATLLCAPLGAQADCTVMVPFRHQSSQLDGVADAMVSRIVQRYRSSVFRVSGHSALSEADRRDQTLSVARANVVRNKLLALGVAENRVVETAGYAGSLPRPAAPDEVNRRAELTFTNCTSQQLTGAAVAPAEVAVPPAPNFGKMGVNAPLVLGGIAGAAALAAILGSSGSTD